MDTRHISFDNIRNHCRPKLRIVDHILEDAELSTQCPLDNGRLWALCPTILRAVVSINATSFSCATLFQVLTTEKCETCSLFGGFLYLITC